MSSISSQSSAAGPPPERAAGAGGARRVLPDVAAIATLTAALLILYHSILDLWWCRDDLFNLHYVTDHPARAYCFDARVWQLLPMRFLMPLYFLSFHLDLRLFGADPRAFYAHQLAAAVLAFLAFYALLRLWLPPAWAALGTGVALAGAPAASAVQMLMTRHYVEGLLFASLSAWFFVRGLRRRPDQRRRRALDLGLSALCYLAAALEKEVFVALVLFFPAVARGPAGRRLRLAAPHLGCLLLYLGWRLHMLGTLGGGNGWSVEAADLPGLAAALPWKLVRAMTGPAAGAGTVLLAALAAGAVAACRRGRRATALLAVAAAGAVGPVLLASTEMEPRYALPLWLVLAAACAFGCAGLARDGAELARTGRRGRVGAVLVALAVLLAAVVAVSALAVNRRSWAETYGALQRESIEDRALAALPAGGYLRHPAGPPASLHELMWFRQAYLRQPPGGGWFADDLFLCSLPSAARLFELEPRRRRVEDVTDRAPRLRAAYCGSIRDDAPLTADLTLAGGDLRWNLGPYTAGSYSLVVGDGVDAYRVPPAAGFQVPGLRAVTLRVRYASPAGWNTYSPALSVAAGSGAHVAFARLPGAPAVSRAPAPRRGR